MAKCKCSRCIAYARYLITRHRGIHKRSNYSDADILRIMDNENDPDFFLILSMIENGGSTSNNDFSGQGGSYGGAGASADWGQSQSDTNDSVSSSDNSMGSDSGSSGE